MAKKEKVQRMLKCERTGKEFPYLGFGRPPKYCPEVVETIRKEQRTANQKAKRTAAKAKRESAGAAALASV